MFPPFLGHFGYDTGMKHISNARMKLSAFWNVSSDSEIWWEVTDYPFAVLKLQSTKNW
jgi:hypothetical protein